MTDIKEKSTKDDVYSRAIIEVIGKPKEHVETSLKEYIEKIKKDSAFEIKNAEFGAVQELEQNPGFWGTYTEIELSAKNLPALIGFCFDYMPSSIEILSPENLSLSCSQTSNMLNDLQAKLHNVNMITKQAAEENSFLKSNTHALLKNFVSILLFNAEKTSDNLSKIIGMDKQDLEKFLDSLVKENIVVKKEDKYTLVKNAK